MVDDINMEFLVACNPLYAVPIVAVILCAFIVYAFGFKSPVQPPSFEGIEEEKKFSKKRKGKDSTKSKVLQNGKLNGSASNKAHVALPSKKKEPVEKQVTTDKSAVGDKSTALEKKAPKKARSQNEKKLTQEKKKDSVSLDDSNDDGWVQLVSKKGRKNRKKDDVNVLTENQANIDKSIKNFGLNKSDECSQVEGSPKKSNESANENSPLEPKQNLAKPAREQKEEMEINTKNEIGIGNYEKKKDQIIVVEVSKPDSDNSEKQPSKENTAKDKKLFEEGSNKSKKKKKKNADVIISENESTNSLSEAPAVQVISDIPASQEKSTTNIVIPSEYPNVINGKTEANQSTELRSSNVAFDELAGLYPDVKEQRKKKKVRRDH